jgi:hypothetical protein
MSYHRHSILQKLQGDTSKTLSDDATKPDGTHQKHPFPNRKHVPPVLFQAREAFGQTSVPTSSAIHRPHALPTSRSDAVRQNEPTPEFSQRIPETSEQEKQNQTRPLEPIPAWPRDSRKQTEYIPTATLPVMSWGTPRLATAETTHEIEQFVPGPPCGKEHRSAESNADFPGEGNGGSDRVPSRPIHKTPLSCEWRQPTATSHPPLCFHCCHQEKRAVTVVRRHAARLSPESRYPPPERD